MYMYIPYKVALLTPTHHTHQLQSVNRAMQKEKNELTIGVLDIYGFEIFMVGVV